jgi:hypothetical protein
LNIPSSTTDNNDLLNLDINREIYIKKFYNMLSILKNNKCCATFTSIFDQFRINDKKYYDKQIQNLSDNLYQIFNTNGDIHFDNFLKNVQKTITDELLMLYYRCILFPHEKKILEMYRDSPSFVLKKVVSPLLIIIDAIHNKYKNSSKKRVEKTDIQSLFDDDELIGCLVEFIDNRSILMNMMYSIFLDTKKNRIVAKKIKGIKCAFFPFKVFSAELFVLEHLLDFLK